MSDFSVTVLGEKEAARMFDLITKEARQKVSNAVKTAGRLVEGSAKRMCPVRTGRLRASINTSQPEPYTAVVGTNVFYGPYVELGTVKQRAQPYLRPALYNNANNIRALINNAINMAIYNQTKGLMKIGKFLGGSF